MKSYRKKFKIYLDDLAKRKPSPGGGSAVCLIFCTGISLIEKAISYSYLPNLKTLEGKLKAKKLKKQLRSLKILRKKIYPYIDKDGYIFEKIMQAKGKKRAQFIRQSEQMMVEVAKASRKVFFLAKEVESGIKKSIISDFSIGLEGVKIALRGCILNLEANRRMFGKKSKYIEIFKRDLKRWERY